MTQAELAAPHYTHAYVSAIEAGRRTPSAKAVDHFAARLHVSPEELTTGRSRDAETKLRLRLNEAMVRLSAGHVPESDKECRAVAKEAKALGLPLLRAKAEETRGLLLERQERIEEALGRYTAAEEILREEPPTSRVDAVAGKARCFHSLGDVRYEIHLLETLLGEIERDDLLDPNALARVYSALVYAYVEAGLFAKAAESARLLDGLEPRIEDPLRVAQMNLHVARLHVSQGRMKEAERSLHRSEDAYRQLNLRTEAAYANLALGYVYSREGRLDDARSNLDLARTTFEETGDTKDLTRTLNELARLERLRGRPEEARTLLLQSIGLMHESDTPITAWAYRELGRVSWASPNDAEKALRTAIDLFERTEQSVEVAVTYGVLGELLNANGNSEAGCEAFRTGIMALE
jgi:tetratricopeptide (TPR) repeat protein